MDSLDAGDFEKEIAITYEDIDSDAVEAGTASIKRHSARAGAVTTLTLNGNGMSAEVAELVATDWIPLLPNIQFLDLSDNAFGAKGWSAVKKAIVEHCPSLTNVNLDECAVQDAGARDVALLLESVDITELSLVSNAITQRGSVPLAAGIRLGVSLHTLKLDYNTLGDQGCAAVSKALPDSLEFLSISDNGIADEGATALAVAIARLPKLNYVNLSVNRIEERGIHELVNAVTKSKSLRNLDLGCNPITAAGKAAIIATVPNMKALRILDLTSVELTVEECQQLTVALRSPNCGILEVEWFNNPELTSDVEKELHETLQRKIQGLERSKNVTLAAGVLCAGIAAVGALVWWRRKKQ